MKVGIISMQKIHNYGSFLQALSLKMQMEARGHDVYFIDILPGKQIATLDTAPVMKSTLAKFDKYFFKRIENYLLFKKMATIHISDYTTYLETDKKLPEGEKFDLVIIGSDEVFNATTPSPWGFSTQLFGNVENAKKVVTYAASCGHTSYESALEYNITDEIAESMKNLKAVSVRDKNTFDFVEKITGKEPVINVDPVFISDYDKFIPTVSRKKPYLLVYAYANRINDEGEIKAIKDYAKKNNLEILCVGMQQRWCKNNISASAFELLGYVKNAECIVTDTFHGTVFSIKFNKKFAVLIRESNRNKLGGLLNHFGLMERSVPSPEKLEAVMEKPIDFKVVNEKIKEERQRSYDYLDKICEEQ